MLRKIRVETAGGEIVEYESSTDDFEDFKREVAEFGFYPPNFPFVEKPDVAPNISRHVPQCQCAGVKRFTKNGFFICPECNGAREDDPLKKG